MATMNIHIKISVVRKKWGDKINTERQRETDTIRERKEERER